MLAQRVVGRFLPFAQGGNRPLAALREGQLMVKECQYERIEKMQYSVPNSRP
jgi:hypothetical protein